MPQFKKESPRKFKSVAVISTVLAIGVGLIACLTPSPKPMQSVKLLVEQSSTIFDKVFTTQKSEAYKKYLVDDFKSLTFGATYDVFNISDPEDYVIPCSEEEFDYIVQLVLHKVGDDPTYFQIGDIDILQQCIAACVINRVARDDFPNTVYDVLMQPGQFLDVSELSLFDASNKRTRQNVLKVLTGNSVVPTDVVFEMGFLVKHTNGNFIYDPALAKERAKLQVGSAKLFYSAYSVENITYVFMRKV